MHTESENFFDTFDGTKLFYRAWSPANSSGERRAVVMFHRGHEHSGRLSHLVTELELHDFTFFAWDQRGHGRSPGVRGYAESGMDLVRDINSFIHHLSTAHGIKIENITVIAHSVSAVLVATWLKSYAPRIRGVVLATPAFKVKLYVPFALAGTRFANFLWKKLGKGTFFVQSYVTGKLLTHDKAFADSYDKDPLVSKQIAGNILVDLFDLSKHAIADAGAIVTPLLLLSARADWVVKNLPQRRFFRRISSDFKRVRVFRGKYHAILHESERAGVVAEIRDFIKCVFEREVDRAELKAADSTGYTNEEYAWLNAGLPMISLRRIGFRAQALCMRTLGSLSDGIKLGWKTGFDSGQSLDYVYRNTPSGQLGIGKFIDKAYLDSAGWAGIRIRKVSIDKILRDAIERVRERGVGPVSIVDVAGGPGRYVIDVVRTMPQDSCRVLIRDWSDEGLAQGRSIAQTAGLTGIEYKKGDAFSLESLAEIGEVDIAIVSGLYELFPNNEMVMRSLQGLAQQVRPGGFLVYTGQPWHPQLEMIAEVLINRDMKPWVMRRRTQAEMDELVRAAGFSKLRMEIDNAQIFTVSLAQKV